MIAVDGVATSVDLGLDDVESVAGPARQARIATQVDYPYVLNETIVERMDGGSRSGLRRAITQVVFLGSLMAHSKRMWDV